MFQCQVTVTSRHKTSTSSSDVQGRLLPGLCGWSGSAGPSLSETRIGRRGTTPRGHDPRLYNAAAAKWKEITKIHEVLYLVSFQKLFVASSPLFGDMPIYFLRFSRGVILDPTFCCEVCVWLGFSLKSMWPEVRDESLHLNGIPTIERVDLRRIPAS